MTGGPHAPAGAGSRPPAEFPLAPSARLIAELRRHVIIDPHPFCIDLARCEGMWLVTIEGERIFDWVGYYGSKLIAGPIGMGRWEWEVSGTVGGIALNNPPGNPGGSGAGGVKITPRDLARFGLLMLNRGNWNGHQLLSTSFVDEATSNRVPVDRGFRNHDFRGRYGYYWWTNGIMRGGKRPWPSAPAGTYMWRYRRMRLNNCSRGLPLAAFLWTSLAVTGAPDTGRTLPGTRPLDWPEVQHAAMADRLVKIPGASPGQAPGHSPKIHQRQSSPLNSRSTGSCERQRVEGRPLAGARSHSPSKPKQALGFRTHKE